MICKDIFTMRAKGGSESMKLVKMVRDMRGWRPFEMAAALKKSRQSYRQLETSTEKIGLKDLCKLHEISGTQLDDFWKMIKRCAK
jgi:DNA-binding XRE family transcriptional regulator